MISQSRFFSAEPEALRINVSRKIKPELQDVPAQFITVLTGKEDIFCPGAPKRDGLQIVGRYVGVYKKHDKRRSK